MIERINLAEIEARCDLAYVGGQGGMYARHHLILTDFPALIAWVWEACGALAIAKRDAEREGWDARASAIDALLSRLEVGGTDTPVFIEEVTR